MREYSARVGYVAALLFAAIPFLAANAAPAELGRVTVLTANAAPTALGQITATSGDTSVHRGGGTTQIGSDTAVYQGDELISGNRGWFRLQMQGDAVVDVWPHSSVLIAGADRSGVSYKVHAGGVGVITKSPVQVVSPGGTVKTTRASFDTMQCSGNCLHLSGKPYPDGLYVWVKSGSANIIASHTATAGLAGGKLVRVAYNTMGYRAFGRTMSDAGSLRLTAAVGSSASGTAFGAGAVVYLAAGAAPVTLSTVPDFFLTATFHSKVKTPQFPRIETGLGTRASVSVSPN